jgi:CrcB protein
MQNLIAIAAGGALGAVLRHYMNIWASYAFVTTFPIGIFTVNILGGLVMGAAVAIFSHIHDPGPAVKSFLLVGVLGAFTTFSTFSLDAVTLLSRGSFMQAGVYILGSVGLSIAALILAMWCVRQVVS